jgi:Septum formation initiator.
MKKRNDKKKGNIFFKFITIIVIFYAMFTFVEQQKDINSYKNEQRYYNEQIKVAEEKNKELVNIKENTESDEFIEKYAREELKLYLPNERVYIDINK